MIVIKKIKFNGFTLAETLITLGVLGVLAAITIPGLISLNNKRIIQTRLKDTYSTILQGFKMAQYENGDLTFVNTKYDDADVNGYSWQRSKDMFETYFTQVFKVTTIYPKGKAFPIYSADGKTLFSSSRYMVYYELTNGSVLGFMKSGNYDGCVFDIILNPTKSKLLTGKDYFTIAFQSDGYGNYSYKTLTSVNYNASTHSKFLSYCSSNSRYPAYSSSPADFCTVLIVKNMFKIPGDYPIKL